MRKLVIGITLGFLLASTLAWAVTVRFPSVLKIKGMAFVDEAGNILGGITPTTVDVVNMPTSLDVNVTSLPASSSEEAGTPISVVSGILTPSTEILFNMGTGFEFHLTDVVGGKLTSSRVGFIEGTSQGPIMWIDSETLPYSLKTPVVFDPGQSIRWVSDSGWGNGQVTLTLSGRMVPLP